MRRAGEVIREVLRSRWSLAVAVAATLALTAPSLWTGFVLDDNVHRETLQRTDSLPELAMTLFRFVASPAEVESWRVVGGFPWWTASELRLAFWRPLTAATHWLDYRLWPDSAPLQHAHSLFWGGLMTLLAGLVFRRMLGVSVAAGLATLLYAIDDAHAWPLAWIANRNATVATSLGLLTLLLHDAWRRQGWRPGAVLAPACFLASLLSAELGAATGAYLLAHALFLDPRRRGAGNHGGLSEGSTASVETAGSDDPTAAVGGIGEWLRRLIPVVPYVVIGGLWQLVYGRLGFGAAASSFYIDPVGEPWRFLTALPARLLLLLGGLLGPLPSDLFQLLSIQARSAWMLLALLWVLFTVWFVWWPLRRSPTAQFFGSGLLLSLVPLAATVPSERLLTLAGIGAFGLLAERLTSAVMATGASSTARDSPPTPVRPAPPPLRRPLAILLLLVHGPLAAVALVGSVTSLGQLRGQVDRPAASIELGPRPAEREVYCLSAPGPFFFSMAHIARHTLGLPMPKAMHALATGATPITVARLDDRTLRLTPEGGFLIPPGTLPGVDPPPLLSLNYLLQTMETLYRPDRAGFAVGQHFDVGAIAITVQALTADGRPAAIEVRFPQPLEDPRYLWIRWSEHQYLPVTLPVVGERVVLPSLGGRLG